MSVDGTKISGLTDGVAPQDTDEFVVERAGGNVKLTSAELAAAYAGGGSQTFMQQFPGNTGPIPATDGGYLPWQNATGDDLLDLTDPTAPTFKSDGTYAVTAFVQCGDGAVANTVFSASLQFSLQAKQSTSLDVAEGASVTPAATWKAAASDSLGVFVLHTSASPQSFFLDATVVKLA